MMITYLQIVTYIYSGIVVITAPSKFSRAIVQNDIVCYLPAWLPLMIMGVLIILVIASLLIIGEKSFAATAKKSRLVYTVVIIPQPQQLGYGLIRSSDSPQRYITNKTCVLLKLRIILNSFELEICFYEASMKLHNINPYGYAVFQKNQRYTFLAQQKNKKLTELIFFAKEYSNISALEDLERFDIAFPTQVSFAAILGHSDILNNKVISYKASFAYSHDSVYQSAAHEFIKKSIRIAQKSSLALEVKNKTTVILCLKYLQKLPFISYPRFSNLGINNIKNVLKNLNKKLKERNLLDKVIFTSIVSLKT